MLKLESEEIAHLRKQHEAALKRVGVHSDGCKATRVIGRFGSRSGLRWCEGDLSTCNCPLGEAIRAVRTD